MCAAASIFRLSDCGASASGVQALHATMLALEQLALRMRHGGFGLHAVAAPMADAALLADAAQAEAAMDAAPEKCKAVYGRLVRDAHAGLVAPLGRRGRQVTLKRVYARAAV